MYRGYASRIKNKTQVQMSESNLRSCPQLEDHAFRKCMSELCLAATTEAINHCNSSTDLAKLCTQNAKIVQHCGASNSDTEPSTGSNILQSIPAVNESGRLDFSSGGLVHCVPTTELWPNSTVIETNSKCFAMLNYIGSNQSNQGSTWEVDKQARILHDESTENQTDIQEAVSFVFCNDNLTDESSRLGLKLLPSEEFTVDFESTIECISLQKAFNIFKEQRQV